MINEKSKKIVLAILMCIFLAICGYWIYTDTTFEEASEENTISENINEEDKLYVYITGGVKFPGVYQVTKGIRVYEAIKKAGDTIPYAQMNDIHLEEQILEDKKIYIPVDVNAATATQRVVNINTAQEIELRLLPGVGKATAQKIIDYRETHGNFKTKEEIKEISGIGEGKYNKLADKITI